MKKRMHLPGPPPKVYWGNYLEMAKLGYLESTKKWMSRYGPTFVYYVGTKPVMVTEDLEIIKSIMIKNFDSFMNRPYFPQLMRKKKERGLVMLCDEDWRRVRRMLTPTFSSKKLKAMSPLIQEGCENLRNKMAAVSDTDASVDVWKLFGMFTMEVVLATAFSRDISSETSGKGSELTRAAAGVFQTWGLGADRVLMHVSHFPWIVPLWKVFARRTKVAQAWDYLEEIALKLIEHRRNTIVTTGCAAQDLLQLMLEARDAKDKTKSYLNNDEIVALVAAIMLAGFETTNNALSYTAYLLALNPTIQDKLIKEINDYYEVYPDSSLYDAAENIEYVAMVLYESLRMFPPAPKIFRTCKETCAVTDDFIIEEGVDINFPTFLLHRNPEYWPNPDKFDPERFNPNTEQSYPAFAYLPFGEGQRFCIGKRLALLEAKMTLVAILKDLQFKRTADTEIPLDLSVGITMSPSNGIKLCIASNSI